MLDFVVTSKIQIKPPLEDRHNLNESMEQYRQACNHISAYCFDNKCLKREIIHKAIYEKLRTVYGLKSQMACSAIITVISRYKTILETQHTWIQPKFKKPQLDLVWNRDYSLVQGVFSVNTLSGRLKCPFYSKGMGRYFDKDKYKFGTAKLVQDNKGKYYLHIPVTTQIEELQVSDISHVVGIDRGINFLAVSYDSKEKSTFFDGGKIKHKRAHYKELRSELQRKQTASARRRLKKTGSRENRWMNDVNHCVSKALATSNPSKTLFVLEDLTNVRQVTDKVHKKDRYISVSWSFYDLEQKLKYKAQRNCGLVVNVDPHYTSQRCPRCGHIEKSNRDKKRHKFCCKNCCYRSNDDRIGAMNLYLLGLEYIKQQTENTESISPCIGVQSITPECNATLSDEKKKENKRSRTLRVRSRATGQLQAHQL